MPLKAVDLDALTIDDEASFASIPMYPQLKEALARSGQRFYLPSGEEAASWDRTVFLNLTFWGGPDSGDVLTDASLPADVVAHTAWHHLAGDALADAPANAGPAGAASAAAMLFGEAIASAFDLYLMGKLLVAAPESDFIVSQMPIIAEVAENAGLPERAFTALVEQISREPERAFEDLRALLVDVTAALLQVRDAPAAALTLESFSAHRFYPLLHHYQLSNWILYARAYGAKGADNARVTALDAELRAAPSSLQWLCDHWLAPHLPKDAP